MKLSTILKAFFWFAFASFLAASIPHVAYFFRSYEPINYGSDTWYWLEAYAIAVSIDVTIYLLSIAVTNMHTQKKPAYLIGSVWVFIVALTALSWYMNYCYARHFSSDMLGSSSSMVVLPYIGDVNPLIASCFQVMVIAYTWIADKIASDVHVPTLSELEEKAKETEKLEEVKARIVQAKANRRKVQTEAAIANAGSLFRTALVSVRFPNTSKEQTPEPVEPAPEPVQEANTPEPLESVENPVERVEDVYATTEPLQIVTPVPVSVTASNGHSNGATYHKKRKTP